MNCIVIYDIVEDKIRNKIADVCLDFGLERIQYSSFFGELTHNQKETLLKKAKRLIGMKDTRVCTQAIASFVRGDRPVYKSFIGSW